MKTHVVAALLGSVLLVGGCSSADSSTSGDSAQMAEGAADGAEAAGADDAGSAGEAASDVSIVEAVSDLGDADTDSDADAPLMVRSVELEVVVDDITAAVTRVRATVTGAGGWVSSEDVVPGTQERSGYGSLVLRVPSQDLDGVITSLGELGEVLSSRSSAEDVTTEYRDVEARVATLEAGAQRLRELIADAPSVEAIASLERELTDREAELDALKARLKVLSEDVSRSTITLHLGEDDAELIAASEPDTGFVAGLRQGWDAFTSSITVLLTALGALLPFLVLAAVVLIPVLWWRRRRGVPAASTAIASSGDRHEHAAADPDRA